MKLQYLKGDCCPICKETTVILESVETEGYGNENEPKVREHVHGGKWEHRKFLCGQALSYIPNFRHTEISKVYTCKNDPAVIERTKKRHTAKESVLAFVQKLEDVDPDFKKELLERVKSSYVG